MIVIILVFAGVFLIINGIYEQRLKAEVQNVKIEYRFIPRSYYDEQLGISDVSMQFDTMFNGDSTWSEVTTGAIIDVNKHHTNNKFSEKTALKSSGNPVNTDVDHPWIWAQ